MAISHDGRDTSSSVLKVLESFFLSFLHEGCLYDTTLHVYIVKAILKFRFSLT